MDSSTCLELALEGERLCKSGDCRAGVAFFEAALRAGTDDLRTLSAVYSQLGNAFFYLAEYDKAMEYHKLDLTVATTMGDRLGVAKASGNLGNTLKVMGKFKEAVMCRERHLTISQELEDKVGEGRALYNLGNVYHAQGKHLGRVGPQEPGGFSEEVKHCLQQAVEYYAANLKLMEELGDRSAQGRACGNLGNTHYLLGNFSQAICYHNERLTIAKEFGDKAAERRAHSNLGNAHIFLGEFETAADHYKKTLQLAQELGDRAVEAQACYSLGNTYTLLRDYPMAIHYHLRHLAIAQELNDRVGEGRACWSLGNAYSATNNHEKALYYANRHLVISKEIGDQTGQAAAQMNLNDIRRALGLPPAPDGTGGDPIPSRGRNRRRSMENMDLLKVGESGVSEWLLNASNYCPFSLSRNGFVYSLLLLLLVKSHYWCSLAAYDVVSPHPLLSLALNGASVSASLSHHSGSFCFPSISLIHRLFSLSHYPFLHLFFLWYHVVVAKNNSTFSLNFVSIFHLARSRLPTLFFSLIISSFSLLNNLSLFLSLCPPFVALSVLHTR
ncbi:UNVERIFIED_CONTAM: hypothetical protein GTU68_057068 [Idotea baltica]|nr:hypothetical protein [Idotea baltica]